MNDTLDTCYAELHDGVLTLGNDAIRRDFNFNGGHLASRALKDMVSGEVWQLGGQTADMAFPGERAADGEGEVRIARMPESGYLPARLQVEVTCRLGELLIRRVFGIYPGAPAIRCDYYLKGRAVGHWRPRRADAGTMSQLENAQAAAEGPAEQVIIERLCPDTPHLGYRSVQFFDVTDRRNNLVLEHDRLAYRQPQEVAGQLLLAGDVVSGRRLFILKEAPCTDIQLCGCGYDFICRVGEIATVGLGLSADQVTADGWIRGYGFATGVATGDELALLGALRRYQRSWRVLKPGRDHMIMQNTWGDRGQDRKLGEAFSLAELEAGRRLGVTHFQLDDGWQTGRSSNSAFGGTLERIWDSDSYWAVNRDKYPHDLYPVLEKARACGIELCLWFNPSKDNSYANWRRDADCLIELNRRYGIRTFKIDGVVIPDKQADVNLRAMFDAVMAATDGQAVFNLDVTAGRRFGYHYFTEYGNKFLENRYTDWVNYYPHWTLRNLWQLSRYVPTGLLQIEFLNRWRNAEKYRADDPLAPARVPFEYCFAVTMAAQPLAWFEGSGLPEEAFALAPVIRTYRQHQVAIHNGTVLPIGQRPDGTTWTGFQSMSGGDGYVLVYREWTTARQQVLRLWPDGAGERSYQRLLGSVDLVEDAGDAITVACENPFSYGLFRYRRK